MKASASSTVRLSSSGSSFRTNCTPAIRPDTQITLRGTLKIGSVAAMAHAMERGPGDTPPEAALACSLLSQHVELNLCAKARFWSRLVEDGVMPEQQCSVCLLYTSPSPRD